MNTKRFISCTDELVGIMRGGGLVAVPTETVYGLAGNGLDEKAVADISVALVRGSPLAGVTRYPCPVEPGLSSYAGFRLASAVV